MFTIEDFWALKNMRQVKAISPMDFEYFCKFFLDKCGYQSVTVTKKHGERGSDRGIDIQMYDNGVRTYVQCKKWSIGFGPLNVLPVRTVRELGGCMLRDKVSKGILMTTLILDDLVQDEARLMNITNLGYEEIEAKMKEIKPEFGMVKLQIFSFNFWRAIVLIFIFLGIVSGIGLWVFSSFFS